MWRNWAIPTYGFRLLEDFIFPTTPQRWDCYLRTGRHKSVCITCSIIDMFVCPRPRPPPHSSACTWGKLPECQSNGEHHEAPEGTTPVPPGFDQTVCLFRFVRCDRLQQIQRFFSNGNYFSSDICLCSRRRAQHHSSHQRVPALVPGQDHVPLSPLDPHHSRGL